MEIEEAIVHPNYGQEVDNDIALIKLKEPFRFSKAVQPACLGVEYQEKYDDIMKVIDVLFQLLNTD